MQKQAPSIGRILVAVGFALSCFGLILFLWVAFGGPIPLQPEGYRITAYFPEATQLAQESDVRIGGVSVGKVKSVQLAPPTERVDGKDTTAAEIEIDPQYAPLSTNARAILRQKTLLGETYIELTSGTNPDSANSAPVALGAAASATDTGDQNVKAIPEGGTLGVSQTKQATQIDEIFNALDQQTRTAFQDWLQNSAVAIKGRGLDLNDALGNLGPFASDASDILDVLHRQQKAVTGLVRDTGTVFNALSARDHEIAGAITGSNDVFHALQSQDAALRETFQILPTFQHESLLTLQRLDRFQANTDPLVKKLLPVANDISPTLHSVRRLSHPLKSLFVDLNPLIDAAKAGLPATSSFLTGLRPTLNALDPFLANLNPVINFVSAYKKDFTNFISNPETGFSVLKRVPDQPAPRFSLRILSYTSPETLSVYASRLNTNRGAGYFPPNAIIAQGAARKGIFPNWDCKNLDYSVGTPPAGQPTDEDPLVAGQTPSDPNVNAGQKPNNGFAPCFIEKNMPPKFGGKSYPQITAEP
jgi:phospholipid/cholesterol/gamma-HCH transport system substrate-binding protein